jgi:iron(III) transport system substrate-binding protein
LYYPGPGQTRPSIVCGSDKIDARIKFAHDEIALRPTKEQGELTMHKPLFALGAVALALAPAAVMAQSADVVWKQTLEKAKTQTLVLTNQGNKAFDTVLEEFAKKFGIKVDATVSRPSQALSRIRTEQNNGQYLWDVWWAITGNMSTVAAPAGMLAKFEDYLILPEVKDVAQWRHKDYLYSDPPTRMAFTYSHEVNYNSYSNAEALKGAKLDTWEDLLNPALKGKVAMRDASVPNAGSFALAPIFQARGGDFLMRFLKEQNPRIYENPEQLDAAVIRGGAALALGVQTFSVSQCRADGGCKSIQEVKSHPTAISRGFAVFKNAPHPEATKVFLNWALSKEGQELIVREWAKYNTTGAVSMRKDVASDPKQAGDLPDFAKPDQYVWVSSQKGEEDVQAAVKIFKEWSGK